MSTDRRAFLVGIEDFDFAQDFRRLKGCAGDAKRMSDILSFHDGRRKNFGCKLLTSADGGRVTRALLRRTWMDLFNDFRGDILFYFSGHGMPSMAGGYLVTQDGSAFDPGLAMNDLFALANQSSAQSILLILDCCYAGLAGNAPGLAANAEKVEIREGVTLLAGSSRGNRRR